MKHRKRPRLPKSGRINKLEATTANLDGPSGLDLPILPGESSVSESNPTVLNIEVASIFQPLLKPMRYKGAHGGRGSGKSHNFGSMVVSRCVQKGGTRIVCAREVQKSLRDSVKLLIEDKINAYGLEKQFKVMYDQIRTPGGGIIIFQGLQDHTAESIKSLEGFDIAYLEEAHTITKRSLELLRPTIRKPGSEIWASWNPRNSEDPIDKFLRGDAVPPNATVVEANWRDNPWFPDVLEKDRIYDYEHNPQRYDHIWEGGYEPAVVGALWDRDVINATRVLQPPQLRRIVIAIDPPAEAEEDSDECGIIAAGIGEDNEAYVLADESLVAAPEVWGKRAVALYDLLQADAIVVEVNMGGDMVAAVIRAIRPNIRVIKVRATKGKYLRAEPISALYPLRRVHHVGSYPKLESQMCLINTEGYQGHGSPDRLDALVYAITELFTIITRQTGKRAEGRPTRTTSRAPAHVR